MNQITGKITGGSSGADENTNVLSGTELAVIQRTRTLAVSACIIHPKVIDLDPTSTILAFANPLAFGTVQGQLKVGKTVLSEAYLADKGLIAIVRKDSTALAAGDQGSLVAMPDVHFDVTDIMFEGIVSEGDISRDGGSLQLTFPGIGENTVLWQVAYN